MSSFYSDRRGGNSVKVVNSVLRDVVQPTTVKVNHYIPGLSTKLVSKDTMKDIVLKTSKGYNDSWLVKPFKSSSYNYQIISVETNKVLCWGGNPRSSFERDCQLITGNEDNTWMDYTGEEAINYSNELAVNLLDNPQTKMLAEAIAVNGGFLGDFPIMLPRNDGLWDSIEGNQRAAIYKALSGCLDKELEGYDTENDTSLLKFFSKLRKRNPALNTDYIEVMIIQEPTLDILESLLGAYHNPQAKARWDVYSVAKMKFMMFVRGINHEGWEINTVGDLQKLEEALLSKDNVSIMRKISAVYGGQRPQRIKSQILAYANYFLYNKTYDQDCDVSKFDSFTRLWNSTSLRKLAAGNYLSIKEKGKAYRDTDYKNEGFLEDFMKWTSNGQMPDTIQVSDLPKILANDDARDVFLNGGTVKDAVEVLHNEELEDNSDLDLASSADTFLNAIMDLTKDSAKELNPSLVEIMKTIRRKLTNVV